MRTSVVIDNALVNQALMLSHLSTKKEVVEAALKEFIQNLQRREMLNLRGQVNWEGSLDEMRQA